MPLFKKNNKQTTAPTETFTSSGNTRTAHPNTGSGTRGDDFGYGANQPVTEGYNTGQYGGADYLPSAATNTGGIGGTTGYGTTQVGATGAHGYGNQGWNEPSTMTGGAGTQHGAIPPVGALNDEYQTRGGTRQRMAGKVESVVGSVIGSETLKAKGLQKEQLVTFSRAGSDQATKTVGGREAKALQLQGQELAQAERLEREAAMRRDRAVAHGAHPANKGYGGIHDGTDRPFT